MADLIEAAKDLRDFLAPGVLAASQSTAPTPAELEYATKFRALCRAIDDAEGVSRPPTIAQTIAAAEAYNRGELDDAEGR